MTGGEKRGPQAMDGTLRPGASLTSAHAPILVAR